MIEKITYIESNQVNPYFNLALEEYLMLNVEQQECILYLWQNRNTVVIGKNQNCWKECKINRLNQDGGHLVRRLSGGGAVYHDLGNLNYTFLVHEENYSVEKQLDVILLALQKLGLAALKTGRNDITIDGKKFSGNAFYETGGRCYHHGTIMVNVNVEYLQKYLNVSNAKLQSNGVDSVRSRVTNLAVFYEGLTIDLLKEKLVEAFAENYGLKPQKLNIETIPKDALKRSEDKFSSWDWIYGKKIKFQYEISKRFVWGDFTLQLRIDGGIITEAVVYSDAMNQKLISEIPGCLENCRFEKAAVYNALLTAQAYDSEDKQATNDIILLIEAQDF